VSGIKSYPNLVGQEKRAWIKSHAPAGVRRRELP